MRLGVVVVMQQKCSNRGVVVVPCKISARGVQPAQWRVFSAMSMWCLDAWMPRKATNHVYDFPSGGCCNATTKRPW